MTLRNESFDVLGRLHASGLPLCSRQKPLPVFLLVAMAATLASAVLLVGGITVESRCLLACLRVKTQFSLDE